MKEGETISANQKSVDANRARAEMPRLVTFPEAFDGEGYNLLFTPKIEFTSGAKATKKSLLI
jgi:hypothetical protein